jgi:hypothetical protein
MCPNICFGLFGDDDRIVIFALLCDLKWKDERDTHLQRTIRLRNAETHQPLQENAKLRDHVQ